MVVGRPDRGDDGSIAINKAALTGSLAGGTLSVTVPLTAHTSASGKLNVRLVSVDGQQELGTTSVDYALGAGQSGTVTALLSAPPHAASQSDLVAYNVVVDDGRTAGVRVTRSLMYVVPLYEVAIEGPSSLREGKPASYRIKAQDGLTKRPLAGQDVELDIDRNGTVEHQSLTTSAAGDAVVPLTADSLDEIKLTIAAAAYGTQAQLDQKLEVTQDGPKLLLTSDKPIYKPGQTMHLRSLSLAPGGNTPLAGTTVTFEIEDAKGNKILKKDIGTDKFGIAATDFQLGPILNEGTFTIQTTNGASKSQKTVQVSQYALPKFDVAVKTEKAWYKPADSVSGTIDARYFFGKLVNSGNVLVEAVSLDVGETVFQKVLGQLDANGHYQFSIQLPAVLAGTSLESGNALVGLRVTVTDSAGQQVVKNISLTVSARGASLALVPEATDLVEGIENRLMLFLTDPLGAPIAGASVSLTGSAGAALGATTDAFGQAELLWTPPPGAAAQQFTAQVTTATGDQIEQNFSFQAQVGASHLIVRTDKSVYETGESVKVQVLSSDPSADVYVDWLNDGQTVDMRTITSDHGSATFTMPVDGSLTGSNRIEAHVIDADGNFVRAGRTIFARNNSALKIAVDTDKAMYAPGDPAKLTFSVTDEQGKPKVAALGVQIVDQAVFSLIDAKPGLLRTFFELSDAFAKPSYEIQGPIASFDGLFFDQTAVSDQASRDAAQRTSAGALAALGDQNLMGLRSGSYDAVIDAANSAIKPNVDALRSTLVQSLTTLAKQGSAALDQQRCAAKTFCPPDNGYSGTSLQQYLTDHFNAYDFWGNAYTLSWDYSSLTLVSAGPDEHASNKDDVAIRIEDQEFAAGLSVQLPGLENGGGDLAVGPNAAEPGGTPSVTTTPSSGGTTPRVRSDFPETLYDNPSIITGADGKATINVAMADSITEWRVSTLANSADGRLGGLDSGVKVFQDFFVDVSFPATLTRGDEVSFPIAVYNYLDTPQTVQLELQAGSWYTALGATSTSVQVQPGQVVGVSFPVHVNDVGLQTLTVKAIGSVKSDAVARTVRVVPDGKAFPESHSGALKAGEVSQAIAVPATAIPGSAELYVDVFPAFVSQAVQGMDSLLRVPTGCFEQTTSTAWPNVLVTQYMKDTKQITPEIQAKAESLMSAGYQRLLTFEHTGGGFSWFGMQDPAPFLSVTAFGLMEFSDMAKVQTVDDAMLTRTKSWLTAQQSSDGSWAGDKSEFFSFQTSVVRNTAFVVWALATAGVTGDAVDHGLAFVKAKLGSDADPYTLGLVANAFALAAPTDAFLTQVLTTLDGLKKSDGDKISWDSGGTQTNFYCAGSEADVSATALITEALVNVGGYKGSVDGALKYLLAAKDPNGNFGSTQATIWTLRALIAAARHSGDSAVGDLSVYADGALVQTVSLTAAQSDVMTTVDLGAHALAGSHDVKLSFAGTGQLSYNLISNYNLPWADVPAGDPGPISIGLAYDKSSLYVNDSVKASATITNNTASAENMVLVTLGVPPGFAVQTEDLEAYLKSGTLSRYELTGRQLILYLTLLAPKANIGFDYHLRALMPVKALDGGAEAHLYYQPTQRAELAGQLLTVQN